MHCDEYEKMEIKWRIAAQSGRDAYRSGAQKRTTRYDPVGAAAELNRIETEMRDHLVSCEICRSV